MIRNAWKFICALDDHWIGDVIGMLSLVGIFVILIFAAAVFQ
jgi:hypothetical protein